MWNVFWLVICRFFPDPSPPIKIYSQNLSSPTCWLFPTLTEKDSLRRPFRVRSSEKKPPQKSKVPKFHPILPSKSILNLKLLGSAHQRWSGCPVWPSRIIPISTKTLNGLTASPKHSGDELHEFLHHLRCYTVPVPMGLTPAGAHVHHAFQVGIQVPRRTHQGLLPEHAFDQRLENGYLKVIKPHLRKN